MFTAMWWSVWWGWFAVWLAAVASLLALLLLGWWEVRRSRRPAGLDVTARICVYLDDRAIMDLYRMGRYTEALTQEVERTTRKTRGLTADISLPPTGAFSGSREKAEERISRYVQTHAPIDVIGVLVKAMERVDGIVHANLTALTVRDNGALARSLAAGGHSAPRAPRARLRDVEDYVLLRGRFRTVGRTPDTPEGATVFLAAYGNPEDPSQAAAVRVTCVTAGLSEAESRRRAFFGHCLGMVEDWNADEGVLEVHPIAIFQ
ncbi:hypothetical protein ACIBJD_00470 [Kitasatospora sp. NPDC050467]|uniref:hypothetical protein n=1 Tax=Kitasatospora sp. NPDC050467 TaxID=3364053 RepID=UPI003793F07B